MSKRITMRDRCPMDDTPPHETTSPARAAPPPGIELSAQPLDYARPRHTEPPYLPNTQANFALICGITASMALAILFAARDGLDSTTGEPLLLTFLLCAVLSTIFGIMGLVRTRDGRTRCKAVAITALSIGAISFAGTAIFSPSLQPPRRTGPRIQCAANLKIIGLAMQLYANENKGQYPPRLEDLLLTQDMTSEVFVCPDSTDTPAPGATVEKQAANLMAGGHCSYIYPAKGMTSNAPANTVLAYEPLSNHNMKGFNILFGDGHVEFVNTATAQQILKELQLGQNPPPSYH